MQNTYILVATGRFIALHKAMPLAYVVNTFSICHAVRDVSTREHRMLVWVCGVGVLVFGVRAHGLSVARHNKQPSAAFDSVMIGDNLHQSTRVHNLNKIKSKNIVT